MNDTARGVLTAVLLMGVGFGLGWTVKRDRGSGGGRTAVDYPTHVEIVRPTSDPTPTGPGTVDRLKVVSANEDGWPVEIAPGGSGPTWKVKTVGNGRPMILFCERDTTP